MEYEVHITRRELWFVEDGDQISLDDWHQVVESDADMRLESGGVAVWTAYSKHGMNGTFARFHHDSRIGDITVKDPDDEILQKMWSLAARLNANVQGDEDERYGPDGTAQNEAIASGSKPWWRFW